MSRARSNSNSVHNVQLNKPTENIFVEQKPMKNIDITNTLVVNDEETHIKPYNNIRIKPKINFVVKLVSLNNTFQKKSLTIPPPPDNLK